MSGSDAVVPASAPMPIHGSSSKPPWSTVDQTLIALIPRPCW